MTELVFCLHRGHAMLLNDGILPSDHVRLRTEKGKSGKLLIADQSITLRAEGALLYAKDLPGGVHTPYLLIDGERYECPAIAIYGGTVFLLPPSHAQITALEKGLDALSKDYDALSKRIAAIEHLIQKNSIF